MKKIPIKAFIDLMSLPKRVALRKLYIDYNVTQKSDRKRCNKAWEMLSNAFIKRDRGSSQIILGGNQMGQPGVETNSGSSALNKGVAESEEERGIQSRTEGKGPDNL